MLERVTRSPGTTPFAYREFLDRARLQGRITHPAVVRIHEVGTAVDDLLVVHEYVPGWSLEAVVAACARHRHPLPLGFGCGVIADVLRGLDAAHRLRQGAAFVHGALDLSEVRVTLEGRGKLKGFAHPRPPSAGRYRSPEQLRGEPLVPASDLFSAGLLLYELLSGAPVFSDLPEDAAPEALLFAPLRSLREVSPAVPSSLAELVMSMVKRERDRSVPPAEALAQRLEEESAALHFSASERVELLEWLGRNATEVSRAVEPLPERTEPHPAAPARQAVAPPPPPRARSTAMLFAALFLLGVGASVGAVYFLDPEAFRALLATDEADLRPLPPEALVPRARLGSGTPGTPAGSSTPSAPATKPVAPGSQNAARPNEPMGSVTLVTMPEAEVLHRGRRLGKTPMFNTPLPLGTQQLEFVLPDGHRKRAPVEVKEGETNAIRLDLRGLD